MARVSDEEIQMVINDVGGAENAVWDLEEQMALDIRDERALLRLVVNTCAPALDGGDHCPECQKIIRHLEGDHEQS